LGYKNTEVRIERTSDKIYREPSRRLELLIIALVSAAQTHQNPKDVKEEKSNRGK